MKKEKFDYILLSLGLILLFGGQYLVKTAENPGGMLKALPYILVGVGCGLFGKGMGSMISKKALKGSPDIEKQIEIDKKDERNVAIGNRAKAKAYDIMVFVYGALIFSLALMGVDITVILLLAFAYLFVAAYGVYFRVKFDKEM